MATILRTDQGVAPAEHQMARRHHQLQSIKPSSGPSSAGSQKEQLWWLQTNGTKAHSSSTRRESESFRRTAGPGPCVTNPQSKRVPCASEGGGLAERADLSLDELCSFTLVPHGAVSWANTRTSNVARKRRSHRDKIQAIDPLSTLVERKSGSRRNRALWEQSRSGSRGGLRKSQSLEEVGTLHDRLSRPKRLDASQSSDPLRNPELRGNDSVRRRSQTSHSAIRHSFGVVGSEQRQSPTTHSPQNRSNPLGWRHNRGMNVSRVYQHRESSFEQRLTHEGETTSVKPRHFAGGNITMYVKQKRPFETASIRRPKRSETLVTDDSFSPPSEPPQPISQMAPTDERKGIADTLAMQASTRIFREGTGAASPLPVPNAPWQNQEDALLSLQWDGPVQLGEIGVPYLLHLGIRALVSCFSFC